MPDLIVAVHVALSLRGPVGVGESHRRMSCAIAARAGAGK